MESEFLKHLVNDLDQLEVASNQVHWRLEALTLSVSNKIVLIHLILCHQVLVWHTRTELVNLKKEEKFKEQKGHHSDKGIEV